MPIMKMPTALAALALLAAPSLAADRQTTPAKDAAPTGNLDTLMPAAPRYLVPQSALEQVRNPKEIEEETGGRLGVAVVDRRGALC